MEKIAKKGMAALVGLALVSAAGLAQAETRFAVQDGTVDKMIVTDKGYVGVGTGPSEPVTAVYVKGDSYPSTQIISQYVGNDNWLAGGFVAYRNNLTTTGAVSLPKRGNRVGYFMFGAQPALNAVSLSGYAEADWTNSSTPTSFVFDLAPAGSMARLERMRITSAGNVGIGTAAPSQKLEVNGAIRLTNPSTVAKPAPPKPAPSAALRGTIWLTEGGDLQADTIEICLKDGNGNYSWVPLN